jgi:hypothetical protein
MKLVLFPRPLPLALSALVLLSPILGASDDPVAPWRTGVTIRPVSETPGQHTIHTYYLTNPESPDGSKVLYYTSTTREGHRGNLVVRERASGRETIIARDIDTEDAHRAACQQWISQGRRVAYHDVKDGRWSVHVVDLDLLRDRTLAVDRQLCFGRAVDDLVPLYGCHWNPGAHRNLELLNVATGEIRTVVTIADVEKRYGTWLQKEFGGRTTSIFFPVISPDGQRVFFKMSAPGPDGAKNNFMSKNASHRQGTVVYDIPSGKPVFMREKWGHPAWHPDSRRMIEAGNLIFLAEDGAPLTRIPGLPELPGDHPSVSPDGKLIVKDGPVTNLGGKPGEWGVVVSDLRGGQHHVLHRFNNAAGASSWRKNHPHPIFSADGKRIYFNVNDGPWTQLHVASVNR